MTTPPSLLIRADGGAGIGVGHLARCLALAQAWVDRGGLVTLVSRNPPPVWADRYRAEGAEVRDTLPPGDRRHDWAVLDGYRFGPEDVHALRRMAPRLLLVDDHGACGLTGADLVLDQNLGATGEPYPGHETLLGARYALLRREFARTPARETPAQARWLLVSLGGAPPAWARDVVTAAVECGPFDVTPLDGVDDVAAAMAGADLAVSAAGSTCWELCRMGLPAVLLVVAPNQAPLATAMERYGTAVTARPGTLAETVVALAADARRRAAMAERGPALIDGRGARRVATRLRADLLTLRPACSTDERVLFDWANDPTVRASSLNQAPIDWATHVRWFADRLADPDTAMYLASAPDGALVGQVRFQGRPDPEIAVSVASERRGQGWGAALVDASVRRFFAETGAARVIARIRSENTRSQSAFEDAGFVPEGGGPEVRRYVRSQEEGHG